MSQPPGLPPTTRLERYEDEKSRANKVVEAATNIALAQEVAATLGTTLQSLRRRQRLMGEGPAKLRRQAILKLHELGLGATRISDVLDMDRRSVNDVLHPRTAALNPGLVVMR